MYGDNNLKLEFFEGLYITFLVGKVIVAAAAIVVVVVVIKKTNKQTNKNPPKLFKIDNILEVVGTKAN